MVQEEGSSSNDDYPKQVKRKISRTQKKEQVVYNDAAYFVIKLGNDILQLALLDTDLDHFDLVIRHG